MRWARPLHSVRLLGRVNLPRDANIAYNADRNLATSNVTKDESSRYEARPFKIREIGITAHRGHCERYRVILGAVPCRSECQSRA